jgi:hypothetical protein
MIVCTSWVPGYTPVFYSAFLASQHSVVSVSQMGRLRHREVRWLTQVTKQ